jgi:hypothetical protein
MKPRGRAAPTSRPRRQPWRPGLDLVAGAAVVLLAVYALQPFRPPRTPTWPALPAGQGQVPAAATLLVQAPAAPVAIGATFAVTVTASQPDAPASAFQFDLSFDPGRLAYRAAEQGGFLASVGREVVCPLPAPAAGAVRLACASTGPGAGASSGGILAVITFEALSSGSSALTLSNAQLADTGRPPALLAVALQHGQVTVAGTGPTATSTATATTTQPPPATATTSPTSLELLYLPLITR